ncbi:MAG: DUF3997 domain-containing protein [Candidatus Hydrogenedentes bacterium]|nr:DUF3997 domain-containing protein [Candidatus Hydrogenedentota bacterium]
MSAIGRITFITLWLLAAVLVHPNAWGSGWNDYQFNLPGGYIVLRANASDIQIIKTADSGEATILTPQTGVLVELATDERFIFARSDIPSNAPDSKPDQSQQLLTIIDYTNNTVLGPFPEGDFNLKLQELGITHPIAWKDMRSALKEAIQSGRADASQPDIALQGQLFFIAFSAFIFTIGYAALALPLAWAVRRITAYEFSWKALLLGWLATVGLGVLWLAAGSVYRWVDMRFL